MTGTARVPPASEPAEEYLDRLLLSLSGPPRQVRRTLAEIEAHLNDAVAEGIAAGLGEHEAQAAAVARLGPPHAVTGRTARFSRPSAALIRRTALAGSLVGGVALVAVGLAAAMSWGLAVIRGGSFVNAPFPPGSYTRSDCAGWLAGDPATRNCVTAMVADHVGDIVLQGCAAAVLGVITLLAYWRMRRRWQDRGTLTALPVGSAEAAGAILAGLVMVAALGVAVSTELVQRGQGAGQPFSLAVAALAAAVFFTVRLWRGARTRAT